MVTDAAGTAPDEQRDLSPDDLIRLHRWMLLTRACDEAALRLNRQGRAPFVVPASGHEGCQIGTAAALERGRDRFLPYYRDLGVALVAGVTPLEYFLGVFAKASDPATGGRQMPSHWGSSRLGIISQSSVIASQIPHASGIAYAAKLRGDGTAVAAWFGEGATSSGAWHEGVNFAAIHRLPVVFICENNRYAISVRQDQQMSIEDVAQRAEGYGIPGVIVDGGDVLACHAAMRGAVARARAGDAPTLIEAKTYRFHPHTSDDDDRSYRSREEVEQARLGDPVRRFAEKLLADGVLDAARLRALEEEVLAEVADAVARAETAPGPDPATLLDHVYAEPRP